MLMTRWRIRTILILWVGKMPMGRAHGPAASDTTTVPTMCLHSHKRQVKPISFLRRISNQDRGNGLHSAQVITITRCFLMMTDGCIWFMAEGRSAYLN